MDTSYVSLPECNPKIEGDAVLDDQPIFAPAKKGTNPWL